VTDELNGDAIRVLAPTGVLGSGFLESSFKEGLRRQPHLIGSDAGSTDPGPSPLGSGKTSLPARAIRRDLRLMLLGARQAKVPLLIGTCGSTGGEPHLQIVFDLLQEVAREEGLRFRTALIHAEQDKQVLKDKLRAGRIKPLDPAPEFDEDTIERATRTVGMMGAEPYIAALEGGADVVPAAPATPRFSPRYRFISASPKGCPGTPPRSWSAAPPRRPTARAPTASWRRSAATTS
jgi:hypothetical protein